MSGSALCGGDTDAVRESEDVGPPPPPAQQAALVKREIEGAKLTVGDQWFVVCSKWLESWKEYTKYDEDEEKRVEELSLEDSVDPGPIDNSVLTGYRRDVLKKPLTEGEDYALLPPGAYRLLRGWFGGGDPAAGPHYPRPAIAQGGGAGGPAAQAVVELYPFAFRVFLDDGAGEPDPATAAADTFSRALAGAEVKAELCARFKLRADHTKVWVKVLPGGAEPAAAATAAAADPDTMTDTDGAEDQGAAAAGGEGDWVELQNDHLEKTLEDLLVDVEARVDLLLERKGDKGYRRKPPPAAAAAAAGEGAEGAAAAPLPPDWRARLRAGDLVDARDSDGRWFESVVVEVKGSKLKIHFKGWSAKWDSYIEAESEDIQPLYTNTPKWRDLKVDDELEVRTLQEGNNPRWYEGKVLQVDRQGQKVLVQTAVAERVPNKWVDVNGEEICALGTHIKQRRAKAAQKRTAATSYMTGGGAGGGGGGRSSYYSSGGGGWYGKANTAGAPPAPGAVGLSNLGNTCFMNSMLQCLSNTGALTDYLLADRHAAEVNEDNPLGAGGKIARAYRALLGQMWSGDYTVVVPSEFKRVIGQFAPQFAGYQQQDSQELMSFLLDGLHEDLNRVRRKPYVEAVEDRGRPDTAVAAESWARHLQRNDSLVVDTCQGQLKSHVTCPQCGFESVTFDPYLSLSLPLPTQRALARDITALVLPLPLGARPRRVVMRVPAAAEVGALRRWAAERMPGVDAARLQVVDVWSHRPYRGLASSLPVTEAVRHNDTIVLYETEHVLAQPAAAGRAGGAGGGAAAPAVKRGFLGGIMGRPGSSAADKKKEAEGEGAGGGEEPAAKRLEVLLGRRVRPSYVSTFRQPVRFELYGTPLVLSYRPGADSNADVHRRLRQATRRFLRRKGAGGASSAAAADADGGATAMDISQGDEPGAAAAGAGGGAGGGGEAAAAPAPPFVLHVTNNMGAQAEDRPVPDDAAPFAALPVAKCLTLEVPEDGAWEVDEAELGRADDHPSVAQAKDESTQVKKGIEIEQCFQKFVEREQLEESDPWYCSRCKEHRQAFKKFDLWSAPDVLILHLKRFLYLPGTYFVHRQKIDELVHFPIEGLDLSPYVLGPTSRDAPPIYDLYAVSEHSGGLGGGHYTAVGKNLRDGKWYSFNDSSVHATEARAAVTARAYVLFYKRRRGSLRWAGATTDAAGT